MNFFIASLSAFTVSFILHPLIIRFSKAVDLMDRPDIRKNHSMSTPVLGGVAILIGFLFALLLSSSFLDIVRLKYLLFSLLMIFIMGIRDDISGLSALHKLLVQVFAAFLVVQFSEIHLVGLYGLMGIGDMPYWFNLIFSIFIIVGITNSFNLLDGIDGLAGSVSVLILSAFGLLFYLSGELAYSVACAALIGAVCAFLMFNWRPAKIFMGDTGSMFLGFAIASFAIHLVNTASGTLYSFVQLDAVIAVVIAILILPIVDTTRVFIKRFWNGRNPLDPDRNHIHHELQRLGFSDSRITILLLGVNMTFILGAVSLNQLLGNGILILVMAGISMILVLWIEKLVKRKLALAKSNGSKDKSQLYVSKSA